MKPREIHNFQFEQDGRKVRFTNVLDAEAETFEHGLVQRVRIRPYDEETALPLELHLPQQIRWLRHYTGEFRLLQITDAQGNPASQIAVTLHRPRRLRWFGHAAVSSYGASSVSHEDEFWAMKLLPSLLRGEKGMTRLRFQASRPRSQDLLDFEHLARRAGYRIVDPLHVTRTAVYDLTPTLDELLAAMDKKTRAKVRHAGREKVEIIRTADPAHIPAMRAALGASFSRTGGARAHFDFESAFRMAQAEPDRVLILAVFLKSRPGELLAYSVTARHGELIEALSSGSLPDPELRKLHFNYFLYWEQIQWAKAAGARLLDLGGITDGGATDPLAGISAFKRHFTRTEIEIGREMELEIRPFRCAVFRALQRASEGMRPR